MARRTTSRDVAARAGVSRTTVSFVLNGVKQAGISEETRQRVLAAVEELGYVPDAAAQALARGRTHTIGLVFHRTQPHPTAVSSTMQIIEGLMSIARQFGVRLLIDSVTHADSADVYVDLARTKRIDGLVLFDLQVDDRALHDLVNDDFPIVILTGPREVRICSIDFDNRRGAYTAVEHLLAQGHSRIALLAHAPLTFSGVAERLAGYMEGLATAGIPFDEALVRYGDFSSESGFAATTSLLEGPDVPTALFVTSDVLAFGALAALHERNVAIPDDIAVVGFDDHPLAAFTTPALTTVRISFEDLGRQAGKMLLDLILGDVEAGYQGLLETEFIVRASSVRDCRRLAAPAGARWSGLPTKPLQRW